MEIPARYSPYLVAALGVSLVINVAQALGGEDDASPRRTRDVADTTANDTAADRPASREPGAAETPAAAHEDETGAALADQMALQLAGTEEGAPLDGPADPGATTEPGGASDAVAEASTGSTDAPAAGPGAGLVGAVRTAQGTIDRSVPHSLRGLLPDDEVDAAAAVFSRVLVWDMQLRRDLRAGDSFAVAYTMSPEGQAVLLGSRYESSKLGRTLTAYRYQASGDRFARYYSADGAEIERRLRNSPMADYEQVTSLLGDRPTHAGMDFMAPVGSAVVSPHAGRVTRTNWNRGPNGNCIEVELRDGTLVKYLHLSQVDVRAGEPVSAGQLIGLSGNTGTSSGPHLHYQMNLGARVLDPIDVHGTEPRRTLPASERAAFDREVQRIELLMAGQASL